MVGEQIRRGKLNGEWFESEQGMASVVLFGGAGGELLVEEATRIHQMGYHVLSLYYFGKENQTEELALVPIEFFEEVLAFLRERVHEKKKIILIGASKGAELSLVLACYYPQIDAVIAYAPSMYCFQAPYPTKRISSWSYQGMLIPFIKYSWISITPIMMLVSMIQKKPLSLRRMYQDAIKHSIKREDARIKLERTSAKILLLAGCDDQMWPADEMAINMGARHDNVTIHIFQNAGHVFGDVQEGGQFAFGGTVEGNIEANVQAQRITEEFLKECI